MKRTWKMRIIGQYNKQAGIGEDLSESFKLRDGKMTHYYAKMGDIK
jgi:hypothetical protein